MENLRIFLNGCNGHMGKVITGICSLTDGVQIVAGADIQTTPCDFPVYSSATDCKEEFDAIIDFSHVNSFAAVLSLAESRSKPLVMCTTGLSEDNKNQLRALSEKVAVFHSANMSFGVSVIINLVKKAAEVLYPDFDIELVESHHNRKIDAPSGTALMIAEAINSTISDDLEYVYDRHNDRHPRVKNTIGIHTIRGGNIVGDHSVIFAGPEENIVISHSALTRDVFARGAVKAAQFISNLGPGLYNMNDLVM
jgi:4-hydroxy-tetrahydrodipicolinate reductase